MDENSKYDPEDFGDAELFLDESGNVIDKDEAQALTRIAELEKENLEIENRIAAMDRHEELTSQLQEREAQETQMPSSSAVNYGHQPAAYQAPIINVNVAAPAPRGSFIGGFFRFVFGFIFWSIAFTAIFGLIGAMSN